MALEPSAYTEASYAALAEAVRSGQNVVDDRRATQRKVDDALATLEHARAALAERPAEPEPEPNPAPNPAPEPAPEPAPVPADGWFRSTDGAWCYLRDGEPVRAAWLFENGRWYLFNERGSLASGWVFDAGNWYYLSEVHDGGFGRMLTGWQLVDGVWYYLYPQPGAPQGSLAVNTMTPDGYRVDTTGAWLR